MNAMTENRAKVRLSLDAIIPNPKQPRDEVPADHVAELAASVLERGLIQATSVRPLGDDRYMIIAGECRWRAHLLLATMGKLPDRAIDAVIIECTETEMQIMAIVENAKRRDVNPIQEAKAYQALIDGGMDMATVARECSVSHAVIQNRLNLLRLDAQTQKLVATSNLAASIASVIATLPSHHHAGLVRKVASGELKSAVAVRATVSGIKEAMEQADIFGGAEQPKATDAELRTLRSMEARIEQVASMVAKGWKDGECQIAKKVDPNRARIMAEKIKAMRSALLYMEYDLTKAAAAGDLLQAVA